MDNIVNITELAEGAIAKVIADGTIQKKIQETVEKTVADIVNDMFRSYSDFGKSLKEQMSQKMKIDFSRLNLPVYNEYVLALIEDSVKGELTDRGYADIANHIKKVLGEALKTDYKLTEIVDMFREEHKESYEYGDGFTAIVEPSGNGYYWISFDPGSDTKKYECEYRLGLDAEGKMFSLTIGTKKYDSMFGRALSYISTNAFGEFLVRAKAQGVKIKVDGEDIDYINTDYYDED